LFIPSDSPELNLYKKIEKDVFKRILKNDELGEKLEVLRDEKDNVIGIRTHQNIYLKNKI